MCIIVLEDIKFFPVSEEDIQYGYDLWKLTQKEFLEKINGEWNEEIQLKIYKDECIRNLENNYLIKYKENIIGWLEYDLFNDYIYIDQLHIMPEYQNKGIGTKILNEYIVYGKKENKNIYLEVLQGNERALEYYKRIGFKEYDDCSVSKTLVYEWTRGIRLNTSKVYKGELSELLSDEELVKLNTNRQQIREIEKKALKRLKEKAKERTKEKLTFEDGSIYAGEIVDGKPHGKGKYIQSDGLVYEGDFYAGKKTGKGKMICYNGAVYEGDFVDGNFNGRGIYTFENGTVYEGDFVNDNFNGRGKRTSAGGSVYEGDFVDGKMHGKGKWTGGDGDVYEGDYVESRKHGKGKMTYADGSVKEGNWKDGKFTGE